MCGSYIIQVEHEHYNWLNFNDSTQKLVHL